MNRRRGEVKAGRRGRRPGPSSIRVGADTGEARAAAGLPARCATRTAGPAAGIDQYMWSYRPIKHGLRQ